MHRSIASDEDVSRGVSMIQMITLKTFNKLGNTFLDDSKQGNYSPDSTKKIVK